MATGDIEHSELPDNLLHEPKGAATAAAGTVYVANGAGSGSFKKLPTTSLNITVPSVPAISHTAVDGTVGLDGSTLSQAADGSLTDIPSLVNIPQTLTNKINENAAELLRLYNNQKQINQQVSTSLTNLENKLNAVINALKGIGVFK
jgi:hypothetical protein